MSAAELARRLKVPTNRVTAILNGRRAITGGTALRLAHCFGASAQFWLNLQSPLRAVSRGRQDRPGHQEAADLKVRAITPESRSVGGPQPGRPQLAPAGLIAG